MFRLAFHIMHFFAKAFCLLSLIVISVQCVAQDDTVVDTTEMETTVDVSDSEAPDEEFVFDTSGKYDSSLYKGFFIADTTMQRLKSDDAFWYANKAFYKRKQEAAVKNPFVISPLVKALLWFLVIGAFAGVLIWFLLASDIHLFRRKPASVISEGGDIPEDIFSIDYEYELEKASQTKDFRLGVRLMYLHVLSLFAEREIIDYKIDKTNSDYLFQLYSTRYYKEFYRLTRSFDYVWYGKFSISGESFEVIKKDYLSMKNAMS